MDAGGEGAGAGAELREHRYVERGDGSVRPRLAVQPKALTEPVWAGAPFGHSAGKAAAPEARPRSQGNPLLGRGEQPTTPVRARHGRQRDYSNSYSVSACCNSGRSDDSSFLATKG